MTAAVRERASFATTTGQDTIDVRAASIILRIRGGDEGAIAVLAAELRPHILRQLRRYPLNGEDRHDVLQSTLLQIVRHIRAFRAESKLSTWIFTVTRNEALMMMRVRQRLGSREVRDRELDELSVEEVPTSQPIGQDEVVAYRERSACLRDALAQLPRNDRELVLAKYHCGLGLQEIADQFELTEPTVRARLHRARRSLRSMLAGAPPFVEETGVSMAPGVSARRAESEQDA